MEPSDYTTISFPFLGLELNPDRGFSIGPLTVNFYGLIIGIGLLLAVWYGSKRSKQFGFKEDDILDGVLWVTPFAILCARLYYCIFSWDSYASNPISILYIWNGGLAIYGGVIAALIVMFVYGRVKKIAFFAITDLIMMGLLNRFTGVVEYYHPTFLYESLWNATGFVLLHFLSKKRKYDGQIALGYAAWYGLGRAFIEGLRTDSLMWGPIRVSQALAAVSCLAAVTILLVKHFRPGKSQLFVDQVAREQEK